MLLPDSTLQSSSYITINEAGKLATSYLKKDIAPSNISYLVQYGKITKYEKDGIVLIDKLELMDYYKKHHLPKEIAYKNRFGDDLNWRLSFDNLREYQTTKHVHRLHPYKGKFIPQLVEYFLDEHTDTFKKDIFFKKGDTVLDPFCGSGTTLVQASELGMNAIGVDVSAFNAHISNVKVGIYDIVDVKNEADKISKELTQYLREKKNIEFESKLLAELKKFNDVNFPTPEFRRKVVKKEIDEKAYGKAKEREFLPIYYELVNDYLIDLETDNSSFLNQWFLKVIRDEIRLVFEHIKGVKNIETKKLLSIMLSRTMRSCRATTHSDLATLKEPVKTTYYCNKHKKICKPLFSISSWWNRYAKDTIQRVEEFGALRSNTYQKCLIGDSRNIDIFKALGSKNSDFAKTLNEEKIDGIFSSPPYVGLINYHEQHAYAYDLFGFERRDEFEIGPLFKGQGKDARDSYAQGIAEVLINCKRFLKTDYNVFLVANDKHNLYPKIAELSGMQIVNRYKRPVLNRVEKDRSAYSEIIFHLKEKSE
ncbi:MAG: DNA methyltransferase [Campylobacterales bacterium]